jgi:hypothetical protein
MKERGGRLIDDNRGGRTQARQTCCDYRHVSLKKTQPKEALFDPLV